MRPSGQRVTRALFAAASLFFIAAIATAHSAAVTPRALLVRRVDSPDPYYSRVTLATAEADGRVAGSLAALNGALSGHFGGGIRMLVKNDLQVLISDGDVAELTPLDRLEVWLLGSGVATRAETLAAFAKYGWEGERWRLQAVMQRERERLGKMRQPWKQPLVEQQQPQAPGD